MSASTDTDDGVSRLLDIVVEEVSLVDRAANQQRFLIVKRSNDMDQVAEDSVDAAEVTDLAAAVDAEEAATPDGVSQPDSLLQTAVVALAGLTDTVELLGSMGAGAVDGRLAPLAEDLQRTAEALLARAAGTTPANASEGNASSGAAPSFETHLAAVRTAITELSALASSPAAKSEVATDDSTEPASESASDAPAPKSGMPPELQESLNQMVASFQALTQTVREQQQRLARVEKRFGLPNSAAHNEQVSKATPDPVGWPLDLNHPMDRESVDKSVSFHDI